MRFLSFRLVMVNTLAKFLVYREGLRVQRLSLVCEEVISVPQVVPVLKALLARASFVELLFLLRYLLTLLRVQSSKKLSLLYVILTHLAQASALHKLRSNLLSASYGP